MPNHVTNRIFVTGPESEISEFKAAHVRMDLEGGKRFDFETVIPMPECIRRTESSSDAELGLVALGKAKPGEAENFLSYPWVASEGLRTVEELRAWILRTRPEAVAKAEAGIHAIEETGHADWYSWACAEWGTKWNAYSFREGDAGDGYEFFFDTAWSWPKPVMEKLAGMWPDLVFECACYDEGGGFGGRGFLNAEPAFEIVEADDDLYELVYGCPPEHWEEDEEEEEDETA